MDRDQRWDRVEQGYDAIVHAVGLHSPSVDAGLAAAYGRGENDEFVKPTIIDATGSDSRVRDGDVVIHFNFRADRARQLTHALVGGDEFSAFDRGDRPKNLT